MAHPEGVVGALAALGKARQSAALAHAVHLPHAASQYFVGVGLVTHIPDNAVVGGIVDVVQGYRQFHHAEPGAEVPAGLADAVKQVAAQFPGQLFELRHGQCAHGSPLVYGVQQRGGRWYQGDFREHKRDSSA